MSYFLRWLGKRWGGGPKLMSASDRDALLADMSAAAPDVLLAAPFNWQRTAVATFLADWLGVAEKKDLPADQGQALAELALVGVDLAAQGWPSGWRAIFVDGWLKATEEQIALKGEASSRPPRPPGG